MQFLMLSPGTGLFTLNVMVASVALGFAAFGAAIPTQGRDTRFDNTQRLEMSRAESKWER